MVNRSKVLEAFENSIVDLDLLAHVLLSYEEPQPAELPAIIEYAQKV